MALEHEERVIALKKFDNLNSQQMRVLVQEGAKEFKASWLKLAQVLYAVHRDKLYEYWGYEKFEYYIEKEVGIKKPMGLKLVKTYAFVEQQEPQCLKAEFFDGREAGALPQFEAVNLLRMARNNKDLTKSDYQEIRKSVMDNGKDAALVRKDLTAMIKERKQVDPDEEREQRSAAALKRFMTAIRSFKKDADTLKLIPAHIIKKADELIRELESQIEEE
ncbi:MAG: hypothetical protein HQL17_02185 [Candidatus Omnitrophica bacterium]|nr:hypothetical protein [Candidatus Omnitrophota bacterium]